MAIKVVEKIIDIEKDTLKLKITVPKAMVSEYEEDELTAKVKSFIKKETMKMMDEYNARLMYKWLYERREKND